LALDVGAGEGADAIWLAEHGWRVTALDISSVALARGRQRAEAHGNEVAQLIEWLHADLEEWSPAAASFDLVSIMFMHLPSVQRRILYGRLAEAVALGGVLLVVGHHPSDLKTTAKRPPNRDLFFTPEELVSGWSSGWTVLVNEERPRPGLGADGESITIHDTIVVARRTA
jgi:SAM-dependent methyltransferase